MSVVCNPLPRASMLVEESKYIYVNIYKNCRTLINQVSIGIIDKIFNKF